MNPTQWGETVTLHLEKQGVIGSLLPIGAADAGDRYQPNRVVASYGWTAETGAATEILFRIAVPEGRPPVDGAAGPVSVTSALAGEPWGPEWEEVTLGVGTGPATAFEQDIHEVGRFHVRLSVADERAADGSYLRRIELRNLREAGGILFGIRVRQLELPELCRVRPFGIDEDVYYRAGGLVGFLDREAACLEFRPAALLPEPVRRPVAGPSIADALASGLISPGLAEVLRERGVVYLHAFQETAIARIRERLSGAEESPVILTSGTAAGKTEAFLIPLIDDIPDTITPLGVAGLFVYPTKALGADQAGRFFEYLARLNRGRESPITLGILDGDTPWSQEDLETRERANELRTPFSSCVADGCDGRVRFAVGLDGQPLRQPTCQACGAEYPWLRVHRGDLRTHWPSLLLVTPDMLHQQVSGEFAWMNQAMFGLQTHACPSCGTYTPATTKTLRGERDCACGASLEEPRSFAPKAVVFDEAHLLKGVFGSQAALLIARLRRIAARQGHRVGLIGVSATIADPSSFGYQLFGEEVEVVQGVDERTEEPPTRFHLFLMPVQVTVLNAVGHTLAGILLADAGATEQNRVLVFSDSKRTVYQLEASLPEFYGTLGEAFIPREDPAPTTRSHTADLHPAERRRVEGAFDQGEIRVLLATQTLEVGVDFRELALELQTGATYSYNDYIQRVGRAGRRGHPALVICILRPQVPLDYYYYEHCRELVQFSPETLDEVPLRSDNPFLIERHTPAAIQDALLSLEAGCILAWSLRKAQAAIVDNRDEVLEEVREAFLRPSALEPDLVQAAIQAGYDRTSAVLTSRDGDPSPSKRLATIIEKTIRATDIPVTVVADDFERHGGISLAGDVTSDVEADGDSDGPDIDAPEEPGT